MRYDKGYIMKIKRRMIRKRQRRYQKKQILNLEVLNKLDIWMTWINKSLDKEDANIRVMSDVRETYRFEKSEREIGNGIT